MTFLIIILMFGNLALIIALMAYKATVSNELSSLRARAETLDPEAAAPPPDIEALYDDLSAGLITIEILNPMELASKESWFAGLFGSVAPALLRKLVYKQASKITLKMLNDFGVDGEVKIHHGK